MIQQSKFCISVCNILKIYFMIKLRKNFFQFLIIVIALISKFNVANVDKDVRGGHYNSRKRVSLWVRAIRVGHPWAGFKKNPAISVLSSTTRKRQQLVVV